MRWFALLACLVHGTVIAAEATYPTKPVRMIVAVPPGGPADTLARLVAPKLTERMGQTIVVDNRSIYANVRYSPLKDFAPITLGITVPNILIVHPSVPATSTKELIALAK